MRYLWREFDTCITLAEEGVTERRVDGQSDAGAAHPSNLQNEHLLQMQSHRAAEPHGIQAAEHPSMGTDSERNPSIGGPLSLLKDRSLRGRVDPTLAERFGSTQWQTPRSQERSQLGSRSIEGFSVSKRGDIGGGVKKGGRWGLSAGQVAGFRTHSGEVKPPSGVARAASGSLFARRQLSDLEKQALKLREGSHRLALRVPEQLSEADRRSSLTERQRIRTQASLERLEASALVQAGLALRREGGRGSGTLGGAKFPRRVSSSSDSSAG